MNSNYVMNTSGSWKHAMKRAIGPGQKVDLSELYVQYGVKHNIREGKDFVEWLRNVKLRDKNHWKIVFSEHVEDVEETVDEIKREEPVKNKVSDNVPPMVKDKLSVSDIVNFTVRESRERLPRITDLNLLRYAYQEANQLSGKDSLCRIIRKRIKELQIAR